jgi:hypothetical protein
MATRDETIMNMDEDNIDVDDVQRQSSEVSKIRNSNANVLHKFLFYLPFICLYLYYVNKECGKFTNSE